MMTFIIYQFKYQRAEDNFGVYMLDINEGGRRDSNMVGYFENVIKQNLHVLFRMWDVNRCRNWMGEVFKLCQYEMKI